MNTEPLYSPEQYDKLWWDHQLPMNADITERGPWRLLVIKPRKDGGALLTWSDGVVSISGSYRRDPEQFSWLMQDWMGVSESDCQATIEMLKAKFPSQIVPQQEPQP